MQRVVRFLALFVIVALYGCGGGGGGGGGDSGGGGSTPATFTIGGTVTGLNSGATLSINRSGDPLNLQANGPFVFNARVVNGSAYTVTINAQPTNQLCTVANPSGTVSGADVTNVAITCVNTYAVGGPTVTGLVGSLILQNGSDSVTVTPGVPFAFPARVPDGNNYLITIQTPSPGQTCTVQNGSGTMAGGDVTDVSVSCVNNPYAIGGAISGLGVGGTVTLANSNGDTLARNANGPFTFSTSVAHTGGYAVTVQTHPTGQTCSVTNGSGTVNAADVSNVVVACANNAYSVGGTVSGLSGTVQLRNSNGESLSVSANGGFAFLTQVSHLGGYAVTVQTNPAGQTCSVTNGSGTINAAPVTNISVNCTSNTYRIGGSVSGLSGNLMLSNAGENLSITSNGPFAFSTQVAHGASYSISIQSQPAGQVCVVANANGHVNAADVTNISVACLNTYTVGGTISGLNGTVVLTNNGGDTLVATTDGSFTFSARVPNGDPYSVAIQTQPTGQTCTVSSGSGSISGANVATVQINCVTNSYTVGGTIFGLTGSVTLRNNGGDQIVLNANGTFEFATPVLHGGAYSVTVQTQPSGQTCNVIGGSGTINAANVSTVEISCGTVSAAAILNVAFDIKKLHFTWPAVTGATSYRIFVQPEAGAPYDLVATGITGTSYWHDIAVHKINWVDARYILRACSGGGCVDSTPVSVLSGVLNTIGYLKSDAKTYEDTFGTSVAVSADGNTVAIGAPFEDGNYTGINRVTQINCVGQEDPGSPSTAPCRNTGAVYVYSRASGSWQFQAYIKATNTQWRDHFGQSVSLSANGNVLAVGAPDEDGPDTGTVNQSGAVYVYTRSGNTWSAAPSGYLRPLVPHADEKFGNLVVLDRTGTRVAIGMPTEGNAAVGVTTPTQHDCNASPRVSCARDSGAVYVFAASDSTWSSAPTVTYIKPSSPPVGSPVSSTAGFRFGWSIAFSADGSLLAVGSALYSSATCSQCGGVYVYNATTWDQKTILMASVPDSGDRFGSAVAFSSDGSTLAVGADSEDSNDPNNASINVTSSFNAGAVYVFGRTGPSSWAQETYVKASNIGIGDNFGMTLALSDTGTTLAIGAPAERSNAVMAAGGETDDSVEKAGAVYVYKRNGSVWTQVNYVKASNTEGIVGVEALPNTGASADKFGAALALNSDGNTLVVGAPLEDGSSAGVSTTSPATSDNGVQNAGAAYIY